MSRFTKEEYLEWFMKESSLDVIPLVREFLWRFGSEHEMNKATDAATVIVTIKEALSELRETSALNRIRVEKLLDKYPKIS